MDGVVSIATLDLPVAGMDCAECTQHVQHALAALPGVVSVNASLAAEKATVRFDPQLVNLATMRKAVETAGYAVPAAETPMLPSSPLADFGRPVLTVFGIVFDTVLFIVVTGEWLGSFEKVTGRVLWPVGLIIVLASGFLVFRNVVRAACASAACRCPSRATLRRSRAWACAPGWTGGSSLYNALGLSLAAVGILPPILAAAQSLPDLGILVNSAHLLRQRPVRSPRMG